MISIKSLKDQSKNKPIVLYDGDCFFCKNFILSKSFEGKVKVINIREEHDLIQELKNSFIDLNDNFVVIQSGKMYLGHDGMEVLIPIAFNKLMKCFLFISSNSFVYKILVLLRKVFLFLINKKWEKL